MVAVVAAAVEAAVVAVVVPLLVVLLGRDPGLGVKELLGRGYVVAERGV